MSRWRTGVTAPISVAGGSSGEPTGPDVVELGSDDASDVELVDLLGAVDDGDASWSPLDEQPLKASTVSTNAPPSRQRTATLDPASTRVIARRPLSACGAGASEHRLRQDMASSTREIPPRGRLIRGVTLSRDSVRGSGGSSVLSNSTLHWCP